MPINLLKASSSYFMSMQLIHAMPHCIFSIITVH